MTDPQSVSSDIAFTATVKALQAARGSRHGYAAMEARGGWKTDINDDLAWFIAAQTSVFLATVNGAGQPYIQHRGGPAGFLKVLDPRTIAFADFAGNKQYISMGNAAENPKAHLFLIDYATRQRVKIWGTLEVIEDDPELLARLMPEGYGARGERVLRFRVAAWDANCPQHIPQRFEAADVARALEAKDRRIAELEAALAAATAAV